MSRRYGVDKQRSAAKFRNNVSRTKGVNMPRSVMRGGWRL